MNNLDIYNSVACVPENAKKPIKGGRLSGMTDINPMWRIKALTETFGVVGFGWKYTITDKRLVDGADGTKCAFVDIDLFVKIDDKWSDAIQGTGGSSYIAKERGGYYTSDECFKMALTDAISVACKALGIGADVYWAGGRTKYSMQDDTPPQQYQHQQNNAPIPPPPAPVQTSAPVCVKCGKPFRAVKVGNEMYTVQNIVEGAMQKYGAALCKECGSQNSPQISMNEL